MAKKTVKKAVKKTAKKKEVPKKKATPKKKKANKKLTKKEVERTLGEMVDRAAKEGDAERLNWKSPQDSGFKTVWKSSEMPDELLKKARVACEDCEDTQQSCEVCKQHFKDKVLEEAMKEVERDAKGDTMISTLEGKEDLVAQLRRKAPKNKSAVLRNLEELARSGPRVQRAGSPVPIVSKGFIGDGDLQKFKSSMGDDDKEAFVKAAYAVVEYYKNTMKEKNELVRLLNEEVGVLKKKNILLEAKVNRAESTIEGQLDLSKFKDRV